MQENKQTPIGYLEDVIPVFKGEGIIKEEAETVYKEIKSAYIFLIGLDENGYSKIKDKVKEIHIVKNISDKNSKFELSPFDEEKMILKFMFNITYTEAIYCLMSAEAEL